MSTGAKRINFMVKDSLFTGNRARMLCLGLIGLAGLMGSQEFVGTKNQTAQVTISAPVKQPEVAVQSESMAILREVSSRVLGIPGVERLLDAGSTGGIALELRSDDFFQVGTATLQESSIPSVRDIALLLQESFAGALIEIEGHTDGSPVVKQRKFFPSNWELSAARAASLLHVFEQAGFRKENLKIAAFGDSRPVAAEGTANRRIVVRVSYPDQEEGG